jgi:hypothetical protein
MTDGVGPAVVPEFAWRHAFGRGVGRLGAGPNRERL